MRFYEGIRNEAGKTGWDAWLTLPSYAHILALRAHERPGFEAYRFLPDGEGTPGVLTYGALEAQAYAIAGSIQRRSAPGDRVVLAYPPDLEFAAAFFGCLYAGAVAVPVPPPMGARGAARLRQIGADCEPALILAPEAVAAVFREAGLQALGHESLLDEAAPWTDPALTPETLAFLQYTSGSTSAPRGVVVDHGTMLANMAAVVYGLDLHADGHYLSWLPHFHDMGLAQGLLVPLYAGCKSTVFAPHHFLQKPIRWPAAMAECRATHSGAPNFAFELAVRKTTPAERDALDLSAVRVILSGAEPIRPATVDAFNAAYAPAGLRPESVTAAYGLAETMVAVALERWDRPYGTAEAGGKAHVSCGPPLPGLEARIADPETGVPLADGAIGEIWLKGTSVAKGYWNRPGETAAVFGARLQGDEDTYLRTGDLGFLIGGELHIAGRIKDLIILNGRNIYPQDVELAAESAHPVLRRGCAAAFAVDGDEGERLAVVCEAAEADDAAYAAACAAIRAAVARELECEVHAVTLLPPGAIPKTSSGKIQRSLARAMSAKGDFQPVFAACFDPVAPVAPKGSPPGADAIRRFLQECVAARTGMPIAAVDARAPFDAFGLGSLAIVEISKSLQDWLGRPLSPALAYAYPTIDALARHLAGEDGGAIDRHRTPGEPIAIVGMACRFPGAPDIESFWSLLVDGQEAISDVPPWRWDADVHHDPAMTAPFRMRTRRGGFLDELRDFDAAFFGISPREAAMMDPQQRLILEVAWEALEHAAIAPAALAGSQTGVFVGVGPVDYMHLNLNHRTHPDAYAGVGNAASIVANRLSYALDLRGPSAVVDTACSSALVAVHNACQALRNRECDAAFAGAVNAILSPLPFFALSEAGMLAPDGRCKTFDAAADGYVRSEGCGGVILKRLADARADGDRVLAVIRGTAVNHVGRSNGLTAPNSQAQQAVIEDALADARAAGADIGYLEAHGTGTSLGDPIEMEALRAVLLPGRPDDRPVFVGSAKTNVGHLESAAGIVGLIKTVLVLQRGCIPPHRNLDTLNPLLGIENTPIRIPTASQPWSAETGPRIAGVSAFGFGGANAHVVLEAAPPVETAAPDDAGRPQLLTVSAKTDSALRQLAAHYADALDRSPEPFGAVCAAANAGRSHHACRAAVVASDRAECAAALRALAAGESHRTLRSARLAPGAEPPVLAMLFTGQGAQFPAMGRGLYESDRAVRALVDHADALLADRLEHRLLDVLFGSRGALLTQTQYTQPALYVLEYALAEYWRQRGIRPSAVLGHSVGEFAAAAIAGAFSFEEGLQLIAERGRLIQSLPAGGAMAAVFAPLDEVRRRLEPYSGRLVPATMNGPELVVVSGDGAALDDFTAALAADGVRTSRLDVSHAFHSPLMDPILDAFEAAAAAVAYRPLEIPLASNVTGALIPAGETLDAAYWRRHLRAPVRFADGMAALTAAGCSVFIEAGPSNTLVAMGKRAVEAPGAVWIPSLAPKDDPMASTAGALASLYLCGAAVDWRADCAGVRPRPVADLPSYPFERKRHWFVPRHPGFVWRSAGAAPADEPIGRDDAQAAPIYGIAWEPTAAPKGDAPMEGRIAVFVDDADLAAAFPAALHAAGLQTLVIRRGAEYREDAGEIVVREGRAEDAERCFAALAAWRPDAVVYGWSLDAAEGDADAMARDLAAAADAFARLSADHGAAFLCLTRNAVAADDAPVDPVQTAFWGLFRTAALEYAGTAVSLVDFDTPGAELWQDLAALAARPSAERQWAYRAATGWRAARLAALERTPAPPQFKPGATYLVTGGFGALGLHTARWLVAHGARHLLLFGRRTPPPRAQWADLADSDPARPLVDAVRGLEAAGAAVRWAAVDAADRAALDAVLAAERSECRPPIAGVFHLAGVLDDRSLAALDAAAFARVWRAKAEGAQHLHEAFRDAPLDAFVLYSSAASMLGSAGQGNYAAANAFLDGLAARRKAEGLPARSVAWGPWADGGMADGEIRGGRMARRGVGLLDPAAALASLGALMAADAPAEAGVFDMDWTALARHYGGAAFFECVAGSAPDAQRSGADVQAILDGASDARLPLIERYIREKAAEALGLAPEAVDPDLGLVHLGLDSIMMLDIVRAIGADLGLRIHVRELFDHASVAAFAGYVAAELDILQGRRRGAEAPPEGFLAVTLEAKAQEVDPYRPIARKNPPCIFVLSAPRSGSTLLRVMLAGHPSLFSPPELHLLHFQGMAGRAALFGAGQDLGAGLQRALVELQGLSADGAEEAVRRMIDQDLPIQEVYRLLQEAAAPKVLVDKSPTYGGRPETLRRAEEMFDGAKYIYLYRHPYSVIESYVRNRTGRMFDFGHADPYLLAEEVWTVNNRNIRAFVETVDPERLFAIRYEEMVQRPGEIMDGLCAFLGLPFDESLLAPYEGERMTDGAGDRSRMIGDPNFWLRQGIDASLANVWRTIELPGPIGPAAVAEARSLGYELPREDGGEAAATADAGAFEDLRL